MKEKCPNCGSELLKDLDVIYCPNCNYEHFLNHEDLDDEDLERLDEIRRENMMDYMYANGNLDAYYEDQAAGYIL